MVSLLIASRETAGKTALCAGIGKKLLSLDKKVGYFLPIQLTDSSDTSDRYNDASFIKEVLELAESTELISPLSLSIRELWQSLTENPDEFVQIIKKNFARIAKDKDFVIIEGLSGLAVDNVSTLACYTIAEALDTKVIISIRYSPNLSPSDIDRVAEELGNRLSGIVINFVPESKILTVKQKTASEFEKAGIKVWGILPEARSLLGISVKEMAEALDGNILTCAEKSDELIENIMLGAMTIDSGIEYFNRKKDKAAIIHGDRADMQLAALQTPTKCLVITNKIEPQANVIFEAESKHIPIMAVPKDTSETVAALENLLADSAFNSLKKLKKFQDILDKHLDFNSLFTALGI